MQQQSAMAVVMRGLGILVGLTESDDDCQRVLLQALDYSQQGLNDVLATSDRRTLLRSACVQLQRLPAGGRGCDREQTLMLVRLAMTAALFELSACGENPRA